MKEMSAPSIRPARAEDCGELAPLRHALWPESSAQAHAQEQAEVLAGRPLGTMP
jgi:hypothetical protein